MAGTISDTIRNWNLEKDKTMYDKQLINQLWQDPNWHCPNCRFTNLAIRELCRNCGYDSNAGEFPYYNPMPPYEGLNREENTR
jgi:hypothetical protein